MCLLRFESLGSAILPFPAASFPVCVCVQRRRRSRTRPRTAMSAAPGTRTSGRSRKPQGCVTSEASHHPEITLKLEEVLLRKLLPVIRPLLKEVKRPAFSKFLLRSLSSLRCGPTFLHGATEFSGNRILRRTSFATLTV